MGELKAVLIDKQAKNWTKSLQNSTLQKHQQHGTLVSN